MKFKFAALSAAAGLLLAALPVFAHHSFAAEFDVSKPITLKGKFVKMDWVNPHSQIQVEVTGADGKPVIWSFEALPPNVLFRMGWRKTTLKPGDEIEIEGFQAKDGTANAWVRSVKTADGRRLFAGKADALPPGAPPAPKEDK
jgi:Family of unknown function (DUF6152)